MRGNAPGSTKLVRLNRLRLSQEVQDLRWQANNMAHLTQSRPDSGLGFQVASSQAQVIVDRLQRYLTHMKQQPPRTIQQDYA